MKSSTLGFFAQLDWADGRPEWALDLLQTAIRSGYEPRLAGERYLTSIVATALQYKHLRDRVLDDSRLKQLVPDVIQPSDATFSSYALKEFSRLSPGGKAEIVRKSEEADRSTVLTILRLGYGDTDPTVETVRKYDDGTFSFSSISGVRVWSYWTTARLVSKDGLRFIRPLLDDLMQAVGQETTAYTIHFGLMAVTAIYSAAVRANEFELAGNMVRFAAQLSMRVENETVAEQTAYFFRLYWPKLTDDERVMFWFRFGTTKCALGMRLADVVFKGDEPSLEALLSVVPSLPEKSADWLAWALWRVLEPDQQRKYFASASG